MTNKPYFEGVKEGDRIWGLSGWEKVIRLGRDILPIITTKWSYSLNGQFFIDGPQVAFWSMPTITRHEDGSITKEIPPRPKRMKKVKLKVRPYLHARNNQVELAVDGLYMDFDKWLGPVQEVEVEVEDK